MSEPQTAFLKTKTRQKIIKNAYTDNKYFPLIGFTNDRNQDFFFAFFNGYGVF